MPTEKRRIVVSLPVEVLKDIEWLAPFEDMNSRWADPAIKRFLNPHLDIRKQVLEAAAVVLARVLLRANSGKLHDPFDTAGELIASLHKEAKKAQDQ